jgi:hypothetical protein
MSVLDVMSSVNNVFDQASNTKSVDVFVLELAEKLDFLDVQILRKFYTTGKDFPFDTQPHCFPILFKELKTTNNLKIGIEALRKRLDNLVKFGFLVKIRGSNPTNYGPVQGKEQLIRATIMKFFLINGLTKFL